MPQLLWDASALAKRYTFEAGSDTTDAIFAAGFSAAMVTTFLVYAETCATLRRKLNGALIDFATFTAARLLLQNQVLLAPDFLLISIEDEDILAGVALTDQHNINSSDAAILATYLRYARAQPPTAPPCILISADHRLLRAAQAEGLHVLNPEVVPAADVPALLAAS